MLKTKTANASPAFRSQTRTETITPSAGLHEPDLWPVRALDAAVRLVQSATYCTLALTWLHSFPQDNTPISHREREWMHELTLNIRFYTSPISVFIPSFVLCTLIYAKCTDHLTSNEPWGTLLYRSTKTNFSKGNWSFPWQPQNHRLTFTYSPYFCCWKRFFRHGKESELL